MKIFFDNTNTSFNYADEIFRHNMVRKCLCANKKESHLTSKYKVVFQSGTGALQVLPKLIDIIPEARFNLIIYYLRQGIFEHVIHL